MVRESGISATKPVFASYLLPTRFRLPFRRRESASSSSASEASPASSNNTTPESSPPKNDDHIARGSKLASGHRLSRVAPDTLRCNSCSADLAFASQIISKGFTGRYGRAFLVAPPSQAMIGGRSTEQSLHNIRLAKSENRQLVTGWHVVADITCATCSRKLGWKYVDAKEPSQKYKVGKFILEMERVITYRSWDDVDDMAADDKNTWGGGSAKRASEEIELDLDDDEECEDVFAGVWDPDVVAERRRSMVARSTAAEVIE